MTKWSGLAATLMLLSLSACGGDGDDALGDRADEAAENRADAMDAAAGNMSGPAREEMEANAEATRDAGEKAEDRIDDSDVDADDLSEGQKAAIANGQ